jgi:hypothetical protein
VNFFKVALIPMVEKKIYCPLPSNDKHCCHVYDVNNFVSFRNDVNFLTSFSLMFFQLKHCIYNIGVDHRIFVVLVEELGSPRKGRVLKKKKREKKVRTSYNDVVLNALGRKTHSLHY